ALELLKSYGSVEAVLENKEAISKKAIRETLTNNSELAMLSKKVATIDLNVPGELNPDAYKIKSPDSETLIQLLDVLEFKQLKERIFANPYYKQLIKTSEKPPVVSEEEMPECEIMQLTTETELQTILSKLLYEEAFYFQAYRKNNDLDFYFLSGKVVYNYLLKNGECPELLKDILESESIEKVTYDIKSFARSIIPQGITMKGDVYDILLIHYLINPEANHRLLNIKAQVSNTGVLSSPENEQAQRCYEVSSLSEVKDKLYEELVKYELEGLYHNLELPLAFVLAEMEIAGIRFDEEALREISDLLKVRINKLERKIYELAGVEFNIKSPKQTAEIFVKMLKGDAAKKTKTGQLSTSESVLQDLAKEYEIAEHLLTYRKLSKVVSTYADSLPKYIHSKTGRIHADFNQAVTATGRLSCSNPNLQNLPILTEEGREVRKAVVPEDDRYMILAADYSQIELRLLAALSQDEALTEAFRGNLDIHSITAAKVFNVTEAEVTEDMRSKAKMVNYGIAYGISPYGLSQNLKIKQAEAKEIIDQYFLNFPSIKRFIDKQIEFARKNNYTTTLTGRRRLLTDINSRNGTVRKMAERIAINAPIQGLAADMIKIAMVNIRNIFKEKGLKTKMILQVHDELVFEVFKEELDTVARIVKEEMENAVNLGVPIEVNIGVGNNWLELEDYNNA
ncbi:MAG TPA: DNA polymerase I, partial [Cytophagaceae bacterium]